MCAGRSRPGASQRASRLERREPCRWVFAPAALWSGPPASLALRAAMRCMWCCSCGYSAAAGPCPLNTLALLLSVSRGLLGTLPAPPALLPPLLRRPCTWWPCASMPPLSFALTYMPPSVSEGRRLRARR